MSRPVDGMNEIGARVVAEAEADLARLLSIEPSPDLAARVRARISAERTSSTRWFGGWRLGLVSLAIVGIVVTLVVRRGPSEIPGPSAVVATVQPVTTPAVVTTTPAHVPEQVAPNPSPTPVGPLAGSRAAAARPRSPQFVGRGLQTPPGAGKRTPAPQAPSDEPEVLVPPDQRLAIRRALAMSREGALDERMFAEPRPTVAAALPVPPIVIEDVVVPPVTSPGGGIEKGFGQIQ